MGSDATGFSNPDRGYQFEFPKDHGPHPDYRIEWWYVTANLKGSDGNDYGLQWTLFRSALAVGDQEGWDSPQVWLGHAAVTGSDFHYVSERFARGGIGQAGVKIDPFEAWIDDWQMSGPSFDQLSLSASGSDFSYDVELKANGPLVFHGDRGYSVKSPKGQASYYYSQPFYELEGVLSLPDGKVEVRGQAWLDREWSSQPLADDQTGWDWFSLPFESGEKLMGFRLRSSDGSYFSSGTWINADGSVTVLKDGELKAAPVEISEVKGRKVPTSWRVSVPKMSVDVQVEALNRNSWMELSIPYWEGPVQIQGSHAGMGYLEMTGY